MAEKLLDLIKPILINSSSISENDKILNEYVLNNREMFKKIMNDLENEINNKLDDEMELNDPMIIYKNKENKIKQYLIKKFPEYECLIKDMILDFDDNPHRYKYNHCDIINVKKSKSLDDINNKYGRKHNYWLNMYYKINDKASLSLFEWKTETHQNYEILNNKIYFHDIACYRNLDDCLIDKNILYINEKYDINIDNRMIILNIGFTAIKKIYKNTGIDVDINLNDFDNYDEIIKWYNQYY